MVTGDVPPWVSKLQGELAEAIVTCPHLTLLCVPIGWQTLAGVIASPFPKIVVKESEVVPMGQWYLMDPETPWTEDLEDQDDHGDDWKKA